MEIVCIHGMGRTKWSMWRMARALANGGHVVHKFGYSSRQSLDRAAIKLEAFLRQRRLLSGGPQVGFVAHSAGGVLLRYFAARNPTFRAGRSVVLGSPLTGSILSAAYGDSWLIRHASGPVLAGLHPELVAKLPPPPCSLAAIAGTRQTGLLPANLLLRHLAPNRPSDSTVLVEETWHDALCDWISVPVVHTWLADHKGVQQLVCHYLLHGHYPIRPRPAIR